MCPKPSQVFEALRLTAPLDTKVVILGQDPYIGEGQAHGLAFSSQAGLTPSLEVIFRELERSGYPRHDCDLTSWANQGVLLLNTILTTEIGKSLYHKNFGWQYFTQEVLRFVVGMGKPIVVMLWGKVAEEYFDEAMRNEKTKHIQILRAYHPAAEARGGAEGKYKFTGCNHFVQANEWLEAHGLNTINWSE